jgi:very-short-patch-repair endonuclease
MSRDRQAVTPTPPASLADLPLTGEGEGGAQEPASGETSVASAPRHDGKVGTRFSSPWKGEVGAKRRVGVTSPGRYDWSLDETKRTRELRRNATGPEGVLWSVLKKGHRQGFSFRRQHPVGPYVLDFYCPPLKLAIELDGGQHSQNEEVRRDNRRTGWLKTKGIAVIRFWNNDVTGNLDGVVKVIDETIARRVAARPTPTGASRHLPLSGGGKGDR